MTRIACGMRIQNGGNPAGTSGCLVRFSDAPNRIMMVTAAHVVVPANAQQNDMIRSATSPAIDIGRLRTWSGLAGSITVDVALIWIDPAIVSPRIEGLDRDIAGVNRSPAVGDELTLYPPGASGKLRKTKIRDLDYLIDLFAPSWGGYVRYAGQIQTETMISDPGDSGAMVLDANNCIVGMVVGGDSAVGDIITPIGAILDYPGWQGTPALVTSVAPMMADAPRLASVPMPAAAAPVGDAAHIASLIEQGSTPANLAHARQTAKASLANYPTNGCAAHLSALLQQAGIDVPTTLGAGKLAYVLAQRGWSHIPCGQQAAGDVGVCYDNDPTPAGADHIYLVVQAIDGDKMLIADNQWAKNAPHERFASGKGKTPTEYFLRAT